MEAVGDARLLELRGVVVPLARSMVGAGDAMGGGAGGDGVADGVMIECAAGVADGVGAVVVVMYMTVHDSSSRLVAAMAMSMAGAVSDRGSACGGSSACCGRYWLSCLLVLVMIIVFWPCWCWVAISGGG